MVAFLLHHLQPAGIASASLSLGFSLPPGLAEKLLKTRNTKKKHNKIIILARGNLNSIESKISEALMNNQISHEDFMTISMKKKTIENQKKVLE